MLIPFAALLAERGLNSYVSADLMKQVNSRLTLNMIRGQDVLTDIDKNHPTYLIDYAIWVTGVCDIANGIGWPFHQPQSGEDFSHGIKIFGQVAQELESAVPNPELWSGVAADEFAVQLTVLDKAVQEMAVIDENTATLMNAQAERIRKFHLRCASILAVLNAAKIIMIILLQQSRLPAAELFQWTVVSSNMGVLGADMLRVLTESSSRKNDALSAADNYTETGKFAEFSGSEPTPITTSHISHVPAGRVQNAHVTGVDQLPGMQSVSGETVAARLPGIGERVSSSPSTQGSEQTAVTTSSFGSGSPMVPQQQNMAQQQKARKAEHRMAETPETAETAETAETPEWSEPSAPSALSTPSASSALSTPLATAASGGQTGQNVPTDIAVGVDHADESGSVTSSD